MSPSSSLFAPTTSISIPATSSNVWDPNPTPTSATSPAPTAVSAIPYWEAPSDNHHSSENTLIPSPSKSVNLESVRQLVEEHMKRGVSDGFSNTFDDSGSMSGTGGPNPHDPSVIRHGQKAHYTSISPSALAGAIGGPIGGVAAIVAGGLLYRRYRRTTRPGTVTEAEVRPASQATDQDVELAYVRHEASTPHLEFPPGPTFPERSY